MTRHQRTARRQLSHRKLAHNGTVHIAKRLLVVLLIVPMLFTAASSVQSVDDQSTATPEGSLLGPDLAIAQLDNQQYLPAIAYNWKHKEFLVVWHNTWSGGGRDIYAHRLTDQGELKSWFTITTGSVDRSQPSVAYDPVNDRYLVVWIQDVNGDGSNWDIYGRYIPWYGPVIELTDFVICNWSSSQWNPQLVYARAQEEFLVVWTNTPNSLLAYVSGRRIFAGGGFPPGDGFTIASDLTENRVHPKAAYNLARNEYLVTWEAIGASADIYALRLSGEGNELGGGAFAVAAWPSSEERPAVAACHAADQFLVTWQAMESGGYNIYSRYVTGDGTIDGAPHLVHATTSPDEHVSVACNQGGNEYLIAWQTRYTNLHYGIWGRLATTQQQMPASFQIISAGNSEDRLEPIVAGGTTNFLIGWEHGRIGGTYQDIHGRLFSPHMLYLPMIVRN